MPKLARFLNRILNVRILPVFAGNRAQMEARGWDGFRLVNSMLNFDLDRIGREIEDVFYRGWMIRVLYRLSQVVDARTNFGWLGQARAFPNRIEANLSADELVDRCLRMMRLIDWFDRMLTGQPRTLGIRCFWRFWRNRFFSIGLGYRSSIFRNLK